jgi:hypothetical protein
MRSWSGSCSDEATGRAVHADQTADQREVSETHRVNKGGVFVSKNDLIWVAIRVIGIYMLVQAAASLPLIFTAVGFGGTSGMSLVSWAFNVAIGLYLTCWGGGLHRLACQERGRAP